MWYKYNTNIGIRWKCLHRECTLYTTTKVLTIPLWRGCFSWINNSSSSVDEVGEEEMKEKKPSSKRKKRIFVLQMWPGLRSCGMDYVGINYIHDHWSYCPWVEHPGVSKWEKTILPRHTPISSLPLPAIGPHCQCHSRCSTYNRGFRAQMALR